MSSDGRRAVEKRHSPPAGVFTVHGGNFFFFITINWQLGQMFSSLFNTVASDNTILPKQLKCEFDLRVAQVPCEEYLISDVAAHPWSTYEYQGGETD